LIYAALTDNLELLQHLLSPQFKGLKLSINDPNKDGTKPPSWPPSTQHQHPNNNQTTIQTWC
jgi:hypothetical protein